MLTEVIRTWLVSASHFAKLLLPDENFSEVNEVRREEKLRQELAVVANISEIGGCGFKNSIAVM
jgi:hypothetical protein